MIVVHHLNNSRSLRILWLLEELGTPYQVAHHQRDPQSRLAPAELKSVHPLGKSPVIVDDGHVLAETGLITEYLCDRYGDGRLAPQKSAGLDSPDRLRWLYWLHYAEGSAMLPLVMKLLLGSLPADGSAGTVMSGFVEPQLGLHVEYWERELGPTGWFAGSQFSAADIIMSFPAAAAISGMREDGRPNLEAFLERCHSRLGYQRALERGGL